MLLCFLILSFSWYMDFPHRIPISETMHSHPYPMLPGVVLGMLNGVSQSDERMSFL